MVLNSTLFGFSSLFTHCICVHKTLFPFSSRPSDWKWGLFVTPTKWSSEPFYIAFRTFIFMGIMLKKDILNLYIFGLYPEQ